MNETKFTPGPWRIDREIQFDCGYSRSSCGIVGPNGEPVLLFDPSESEYALALDADSADAYLIAAAPDMYEILEWLNHKGGLGLDVHKAIDAALAKARGEE